MPYYRLAFMAAVRGCYPKHWNYLICQRSELAGAGQKSSPGNSPCPAAGQPSSVPGDGHCDSWQRRIRCRGAGPHFIYSSNSWSGRQHEWRRHSPQKPHGSVHHLVTVHTQSTGLAANSRTQSAGLGESTLNCGVHQQNDHWSVINIYMDAHFRPSVYLWHYSLRWGNYTVWVKKIPLRFSDIFPQTVGNF